METKADRVVHLGDLGGYAPFVNEVVEFLIEHSINGVQGNYDDAVANDEEQCGCKYEDPVQERMTALSFEWTKKHATQKTKEYLKGLAAVLHFFAQGKKIVRDKLVIRLEKELKDDYVRRLNDMFPDLIKSGKIFRTPALPEEKDEPDLRSKPRIAFAYKRKSAGRLNEMILTINRLGRQP